MLRFRLPLPYTKPLLCDASHVHQGSIGRWQGSVPLCAVLARLYGLHNGHGYLVRCEGSCSCCAVAMKLG